MSVFRLWLFCMVFVSAGPLAAHEFWIEPLDFTPDAGEPMQAYLKVGQEFNGSTYPFIPQRFRSFDISFEGRTEKYQGRAGDSPALQVNEPRSGLKIITYHSKAENLVFRKPELLENYLTAEGLEPVLEKHRADGLPETGFSEDYTRNAKALVQIGPYTGGVDQVVGMPFELVVKGSPYDGSKRVTVQLLWQGKPVADYPINVFTKAVSVRESRVRTDANGFATVDFPAKSMLLLNSVWIRRTPETRDALYESWWASLTFGR